MGRKKNKPRHARPLIQHKIPNNSNQNPNFTSESHPEIQIPFYVDVLQTTLNSTNHRDISEILLTNLKFSEEFNKFELNNEFYLRFRLCNVNDHLGRIKLGHWPVISSEDVYLECYRKRVIDENECFNVVFSGNFDGSDEGVSGLVHLVSLKFMTLRIVDVSLSVRVRVEILQCAFDACGSLLDDVRQLWKKSMMSVMGWVRPEVTTSEVRYGVGLSGGFEGEGDSDSDGDGLKFDVGRFYEAIKRSKDCPMLNVKLPDLITELRPYQSRAAYWMVQREKGDLQDSAMVEENVSCSPLCVAVDFLESSSRMFYNPFRYILETFA